MISSSLYSYKNKDFKYCSSFYARWEYTSYTWIIPVTATDASLSLSSVSTCSLWLRDQCNAKALSYHSASKWRKAILYDVSWRILQTLQWGSCPCLVSNPQKHREKVPEPSRVEIVSAGYLEARPLKSLCAKGQGPSALTESGNGCL